MPGHHHTAPQRHGSMSALATAAIAVPDAVRMYMVVAQGLRTSLRSGSTLLEDLLCVDAAAAADSRSAHRLMLQLERVKEEPAMDIMDQKLWLHLPVTGTYHK